MLKEYERLSCEICGKQVLRKWMKDHLRNHAGNTYECDICHKQFPYKQYMLRHRREVHVKEKKYACDRCDFKTNTQNNLQSHVNAIHLKLKNHVCPVCGLGFTSNSNMRGHLKNVYKDVDLLLGGSKVGRVFCRLSSAAQNRYGKSFCHITKFISKWLITNCLTKV